MYDLLKKLWKFRKSFFLFVTFTFLLFVLRFPLTETLENVFRESQKQMSMDIEFDKMKLKFLPPGVAFHEISFNHDKLKESFILDRFLFSMALGKWLALKKAWTVKGFKDSSSFLFTFWKQKRKVEDLEHDYLYIEGGSSFLDFSFLEDLSPSVKMKGKASFDFKYEGDIENLPEAKGILNFKASQIHWLQSQIETNIGPLDLPQLKWSQAKAIIRLKEGNIVLESLVLGDSKDRLHLKMRGNGEILYLYNQFRLGAYDFQIQLEVDKSLYLSLVDLMLSGTKKELPTKYLYQARITGQGSGPPNIELLPEF